MGNSLMKTRFLCGLIALTFAPLMTFGALSTTTSYFLNVESLTNVTARSAVSGATGAFTNGVSAGLPVSQQTFLAYPASSAVWWGSTDFTGFSFASLSDNVSSGNAIILGTYDPTAVNDTYSYSQYSTTTNGVSVFSTYRHGAVTIGGFELKATGDGSLIGFNSDTYLTRRGVGLLSVNGNLGAELSVGDTTFVDLSKASQTNSVTGAITIAHATNGVHGIEQTHARWFFVPSGGPHTLTLPALWRTNVYSAKPPALTNGTITVMYVKSGGPTDTAARQTNVYCSFEYFK
jgi:hypothetical protein